jgi:hypothetical protein
MIHGAKNFGKANLRQKAAKMRRCHFLTDQCCKSVPASAVAFADFAFQFAGLATLE